MATETCTLHIAEYRQEQAYETPEKDKSGVTFKH